MHVSPEPTSPFNIETERSEGTTRLVLTGELDIATADSLGKALEEAQMASGDQLVVDLSAVSFMDSTGLRQLISAHRDSEARGYSLTVVTGSSPAKRVFELTHMDDLLNVVESLD